MKKISPSLFINKLSDIFTIFLQVRRFKIENLIKIAYGKSVYPISPGGWI